jgi:hypothetical protein
MAAEPRLHRRILSHAFLSMLEKAEGSQITKRFVMPIENSNRHYLFLLCPRSKFESEKEYRTGRKNILQANCLALKYRLPEAKSIVGLAMEPGINFGKSEDGIFINLEDWSNELLEETKKLMIDYRIPENIPSGNYQTTKEYPDIIV